MGKIHIILDAAMCIFWIATYALVFAGTIKYHYPLISPEAQGIIAPFEFSVLFLFHSMGQFGTNYATIAYVLWALLEIAIIVATIKIGFIERKHIIPYLCAVLVITCLMLYLVAIKHHMLEFSYFNTFLGEIIWFRFVLRKTYPMKPITLSVFVVKFLADAMAVPVYVGDSDCVINAICVLLPFLDAAFIMAFINRLKNEKKQTMSIAL